MSNHATDATNAGSTYALRSQRGIRSAVISQT
jgi:hypothetical protein